MDQILKHKDLFESTYHVTLPAGMGPDGRSERLFTSLDAWEGYLAFVRSAGHPVALRGNVAQVGGRA